MKKKIQTSGNTSLLAPIVVTDFAVLPQYAKKCSCLYARDQANYLQQHFLYIEDLGKDCLINIYGRQERLLNVGADHFKNERYDLQFTDKINTGKAGQNDLYNASMIIKNTKGESVKISVTGVCGCD